MYKGFKKTNWKIVRLEILKHKETPSWVSDALLSIFWSSSKEEEGNLASNWGYAIRKGLAIADLSFAAINLSQIT